MKIKLNKKIMIALFFAIIWMVLNNVSFAGTQKWKSLNYDATLNSDGSMDVIETWNIYVSQTNTLFKDFNLNRKKFSEITDVKVRDLSSGMDFMQINEEMYHVTKNCYYGLPISGNKFEIAWGVGLDDSSDTRKYEISYKVKDVVTVYNDCSELYWQFLGTDNAIKADKITGTIKLPQKVTSLDSLRVWAHGPLNGEIQKESKDTVIFEVSDFDVETMLEVRVVTEDEMFLGSTKMVKSAQLQNIIQEETKWANEANNKRRMYRSIFVIVTIIFLIIIWFFFKKIIKYYNQSKELPQKYSEIIDMGEYFRDIPREKESTPAEAAYLYYSKNNHFGFYGNQSKVFSATILQLCLKKVVSLEKEGKDIRINILCSSKSPEISTFNLKQSELDILKLLEKCCSSSSGSVTMSEIKRYAKKEYDRFEIVMSGLSIDAKNAHDNIGNFDENNETELKKYKNAEIIYVLCMFLGFPFCIFNMAFIGIAVTSMISMYMVFIISIYIEVILCIIMLKKCIKKINVLTEQGETERQEWKGLKKYMEDFSLLKERDIPDLVLWEKYLVYATAFGISDKVIKQLKVVYPQISDMDNNSQYTYMHLMSDSRLGSNFINDFNSGIESAYNSYKSAYNAAHSSNSSGSGGGGGFSGGGGGRRRRRPDAEADKF